MAQIVNYDGDWGYADFIRTPFMRCPYGLEGNAYKFRVRLFIDESQAHQIFLKKYLQHLKSRGIDQRQLFTEDYDTKSLGIRVDFPMYTEIYSVTKEKLKVSRTNIRPNCLLKVIFRVRQIDLPDSTPDGPDDDNEDEIATLEIKQIGRTYKMEALQMMVKYE